MALEGRLPPGQSRCDVLHRRAARLPRTGRMLPGPRVIGGGSVGMPASATARGSDHVLRSPLETRDLGRVRGCMRGVLDDAHEVFGDRVATDIALSAVYQDPDGGPSRSVSPGVLQASVSAATGSLTPKELAARASESSMGAATRGARRRGLRRLSLSHEAWPPHNAGRKPAGGRLARSLGGRSL
jgi:hypothetical protein